MHRYLKLLGLFFLLCLPRVRAQVVDDFEDGDFTTNPAWIGATDSFSVSSGQLRSTPGNASSVTLSLATASTQSFTQWEFFFRLNFNPSSQNYAEFWLSTDDLDLAQAQNGIFVRLGGNTGDGIGLFKKQNGSVSTLIDPAGNTLVNNSSNNQGVLRIVRNGANWELLQKITGPDFISVGSASDGLTFSSQGLGVLIRSTKTNRGKHYFDDIRAEDLSGPDLTPPSLLSAAVVNATQLDLAFSEPLDEAFSGQANLYSISPPQTISSALRLAADPSRVRLNLAAPLPAGSYTVQVAQSRDLAGNTQTSPQSQTFSYAPGTTPGFRVVVINEILADESPSAGLPGAEFVELHNPGTVDMPIGGWTLSDPATTAIIPAITIPAGGYLILCRTADTTSYKPFGKTVGINLPSLNNSGDRLTLKADNQVIDEVNYALSWYGNPQKDDGGFSLEQINPKRICSDASNWKASDALIGGTPGAVNSLYNPSPDTLAPGLDSLVVVSADTIRLVFSEILQNQSITPANFSLNGPGIQTALPGFPRARTVTLVLSGALTLGTVYTLQISSIRDCEGNAIASPISRDLVYLPPAAIPFRDVVINEIYADESPALGLPKVEYLELYNTGIRPYQLQGCLLRVGSTERILPAYILNPGQYVVLTKSDSVPLFTSLGPVLGMEFPQLTNTGAEIRLVDPTGGEVDRVTYTLAWYQDPDKDDGGYSLEQINPLLKCSGALNWRASNAATGGTPGQVNSIFSNAPDLSGPVLVQARILGPQSIQLTFSEPLGTDPETDSLQLVGFPGTLDVLYRFPDPETMVISLSEDLQAGQLYTLRGKQIPDCNGNLSTPFQIQIGIGLDPERFDLLLTEVQADDSPENDLPEAEYVELENRSGKLLQLQDLVLSDGSSNARFPAYLLPAGGRLVVSSTSGAPKLASALPGVAVLGVTSFPSLSLEGEKLFLVNARGRWVHRFFYASKDYSPYSLLEKGWSLEMIDPTNPCDEKGNWAVSTASEGGTPGKENSVRAQKPDAQAPKLVRLIIPEAKVLKLVFSELADSNSLAEAEITVSENRLVTGRRFAPGDFSQMWLDLAADVPPNTLVTVTLGSVRDCAGNESGVQTATAARPNPAQAGDWMLNEILFDPKTGGSDYVEIKNRSPHYLDLSELRIANREEGKKVSEDIFPIEPGGLVVFTNSIPLTLRDYPQGDASRFIEVSLPTFSADSGTVRILGPQDQVWEKYFYAEKHHAQIIDETKGVSLERISPNLPSENPDSWQSASRDAGFGTPGRENSQSRDYDPSEGFAADPDVISPNGDGNKDFTFFRYTSDKTGRIANLRVYSADGVLVKRVTESSNLGTENEWKWDGRTEEGRLARMGVYMAVLELIELGGDTRYLKIPIALAHDR